MATYIYHQSINITHKFRGKWLLGVEWCDFVVYSNGCVIVDQILANLDYWNNLLEKLKHFYVTHVIPEILSGRIFMEEFGTTT